MMPPKPCPHGERKTAGCRPCKSAYDRARAAKTCAQRKAYRASRPPYPEEKRREWRQRYYLKHRDEILRRERERRRRNGYIAQKSLKLRRRGVFSDGSVERMFTSLMVAAYKGKCAYCSREWKEIDHVVPLSRGGKHVIVNVRPACKSCNRIKSARTWVPRPWAAQVSAEENA